MDSVKINRKRNWRISSLCCLALPHMALLSIQATSPERRFTQKEIIAGEERPKYLLIKQHQDGTSPSAAGTIAPSTGKFPSNILICFISFFLVKQKKEHFFVIFVIITFVTNVESYNT